MRKNAAPKNSPTKDYWLVTTEHLKEGLWFREDGDFKVGMNYVALSALFCSILIIAFVLTFFLKVNVIWIISGAAAVGFLAVSLRGKGGTSAS